MGSNFKSAVTAAAVVMQLAGVIACAHDSRVFGPTDEASLSASRGQPPWAGGPEWSPWTTPVNLGPVINGSGSDRHATISKDQLTLYFASNRPGGLGGLDVWVSTRATRNDAWGAPRNLGSNINSNLDDLAVAFPPDDHYMYFHSSGRGGCGGPDLFVSHRRDRHDPLGWEPAVNLGCVVNSAFDDAGATIFVDETTGFTTLIFTSTRPSPAPFGDFDIYQSTKPMGGDFGPPQLIPELSAGFRDTRTTISRDGLTLYLSSDSQGRIGGFGGQDIWVSTRPTTTSAWSTPVNAGPVVNSTAFDGAPSLSFHGDELYFFSDRAGGFGGNDLYVTRRRRGG